ncbi:MAG: hypothetical protein QG567_1084 [Campylobacterota bacterium]|nr:hypothetical protein [Campylobacterota bacterium]
MKIIRDILFIWVVLIFMSACGTQENNKQTNNINTQEIEGVSEIETPPMPDEI